MLDRDDEEGARDPYYIRASPTGADLRRLVAKCDEAFLVADQHGDFPDLPESEFGLYVDGTRFLRSLELAVHGWPGGSNCPRAGSTRYSRWRASTPRRTSWW
jgi:hypothetical protein